MSIAGFFIMKKAKILILCSVIVSVIVAQPLSSEIMDFGTNPGNLSLFYYAPETEKPNCPMVVVLHGCSQGANAVAELTGWNKLAKEYGFYVMYPQQHFPNNPSHCFNWFKKNEIERGNGECESIKQMVEYMVKKFEVNQNAIYVTGLSAGAAMSVVMIATQPSMFKAAAIFAGGPYKPGSNIFASSGTMIWGVNKTPEQWKDLVWRENPAFKSKYPKVFIYHGMSDPVVNIRNASELVEQWTALHKIDTIPLRIDSAYFGKKDITRIAYINKENEEVVVFYKIRDMGHAIPVGPGNCKNQGGRTALFATDKKLYSTYHAACEFGLIPDWRIEGPDEVDAEQKSVEYKVQLKENYKYEWLVPEGCIVTGEKSGAAILVNWNKNNGKIILKETAPDGCHYEHPPVYVKVKTP